MLLPCPFFLENTMKNQAVALSIFAALLAEGCSSRAEDAEAKAIAAITNLVGEDGRDVFNPGHPANKVNLFGTAATDATLKELPAFPLLETLRLGHTKVTDAGMKDLASL